MSATTIDEYLAALPEDRRAAVAAVRATILENLAEGYEEGISHDSISYYVPHSICPDGYHCDPAQPVPFADISGTHAKLRLDMFCLYVDREAKQRFVDAWKETGHKLDMGASCVRFKKLEDLALDVVGQTIASIPVTDFLERQEAIVPASARKKRGR